MDLELIQKYLKGREEKIKQLVEHYRKEILNTPLQSSTTILGREVIVTQKVHVDDPEKADATFYFPEEEETIKTYFYPFEQKIPAPRYTLKDLPRLITRFLAEADGSKWFVSVPGTLRGKQRNKALYSRAHFTNTVLEKVAAESRKPARKIEAKLADGTVVKREEGISPVKAQTLRKQWRR